MADSISNNIFALFSTPESAKKVSMKESMQWKNIFDKNMLEMFKQVGKNDISSLQYRSDNGNYSKTSGAEKQTESAGVSNKAKSNSALQESKGSQSQLLETNKSAQNLNIDMSPKISASIGLNQVFQTLDNVNTKLNILSANSASNKSFQAYNSTTSNMSLARIHFMETEDGVKIYVRNNYLDKNSMIELVKDVLEKFNHTENAIHEIVYNGKPLTI